MANWNERVLAAVEDMAGGATAGNWNDRFQAAMETAAAAAQDLLSYLTVTVANLTGNTGTVTIQAMNAADEAMSVRYLARVWIADAAYSEPDAQSTFNVGIGELFKEWEANAWQDAISDATGKMVFTIEVSAPKTVHVMAEHNGRIYTGNKAIT